MRVVVAPLLIAAVIGCEAAPEIMEAPEPVARRGGPSVPLYRVEIIRETLGGPESRGSDITHRGWVAGFSFLPDRAAVQATLWRSGVLEELGTLGGPSSRVPWPGMNERGLIAGISHTGELDPMNEGWSCEAGGFLPGTSPRRVCRGFVWHNGAMTELPTLGGTHGFAASINNRGQIVGWAETPVHDPTCVGESPVDPDPVQILQFRAVMWEPRRGKIRELPPLPGDSASSAVGINEWGQAVGNSGDCDQAVGRRTGRHSVLWDRGEPREIPNLGGTMWHTPQDINERGDVVGFSNLPGDGPPENDGFNAHAFLWFRGSDVAIDLGTLADHAFSQAQAISNRRQVVGVSFGGAPLRAFLWQNGELFDLNELAGPEFGTDGPFELRSARDITESGTITGDVLEKSTNLIFPFVATPHGRRHGAVR